MKKCNELREASGRKRKIESGESELSTSSAQVKTRRFELVQPENSDCESSDHVFSSCCSSDGSSDLAKERLKSVDLEENDVIVEFIPTSDNDSSDCRRETGELEFNVTAPHELNPAVRKPSEGELDEFFASAEKDLQNKFIEKYNYDIVKDMPLEGRYEWVELKP